MPGKSADMKNLLLILACVGGVFVLSVPADAGIGSRGQRDPGLAGDRESLGLMTNKAGTLRYPVTIPQAADGMPAQKCDNEAECVQGAAGHKECGWLEEMGVSNDGAAMCNLYMAVSQYCNSLWRGRDSATLAEQMTCFNRLMHAAGFFKWYGKHDPIMPREVK